MEPTDHLSNTNFDNDQDYEGFDNNSANITNKSNHAMNNYNAKSFNKSEVRMNIIYKMNLMKGFLEMAQI